MRITPRVQAQLRVGALNDPLEHAADRVADTVMAGGVAAPSAADTARAVRRSCSACAAEADDEPIRRSADGGMVAPSGAARAAAAVASAGAPLAPSIRNYFEPRFGRSFAPVRVHTDAAAAGAANAIGARAYTLRDRVAFATGAYAPDTAHGRRLIAHELAHVAQQSPASSDSVVRRSPAASGAGDLVDPAAAPAKPDVTLVHDRVDRIIISCSSMRMSLVTRSETHQYRLSSCDKSVAPGEYTADVTVDKARHDVGFAFHIGGKARRLFKGGFIVHPGQISPVELLTDQDSVPVDYETSASGLAIPRPECLVTLPPQQLFAGGADTKNLTDMLPKIPVLKWELAEFGAVDVKLRLGIVATAAAGYTYKAGMLDDICMVPSLRHPFGGHARFTTGGQAELHMDVTIGVEVGVELLHAIDLLTAHGELKLDLDAAVSGDIDTLVEISHNPLKPDDFKLKTEVDLAAMAGVGYNLSGFAGLDFLGYPLWQGSIPSIVKGGLGYAWSGGLLFDDSFKPQAMLGSFAKAAPGQLNTGALRTHGPRRPAQKQALPVKELVEASIHDKDGKLTADGLSCDKALPLHWFKPRHDRHGGYPEMIEFGAPDIHPDRVMQEDGPTPVSHPDVPTFRFRGRQRIPGDPVVSPTDIGVKASNWPESRAWSTCFQYIPSADDRAQSNAFRDLMAGLDARYDGIPRRDSRLQMDHIRELQFGGKDRFDNIWPFDASANGSAGTYHQKQIDAYRKLFPSIDGRYFKISGVGLDPDKAAKL